MRDTQVTDITLKKRRSLLMGGTATALAGLVLGLMPVTAAAQSQQQTEDDLFEVEEIIVTGSRLANTNVTSPVPVVQISADEIDARGAIRIEDMLNILPQVFAGQASEVSNAASGTSTLDLRGLGANRTLVLIDGKRLPFGSASIAAPNLDIVPSQLVERIDVVTGGASAVYGSDAIGGVANFVLKRDFEGIEIDGQVGFHQTSNNNSFMEGVLNAAQQPIPNSATDGRDVFLTLTMGANTADGKGNATLHVNYQNQNEILQADRVDSACALGASSSQFSFQGVGCVGSTSFRRFFLPGGDVFLQEDGTLIPFSSNPQTTFNFGPLNFFQRPNERFTINARGHYEITDSIEAYADLTFMNNNTAAQIAPSASFFRPFQTNCDNPLLNLSSTEGGETMFDLLNCGSVVEDFNNGERDDLDVAFTNAHRNVEGDPRITEIDNTTWRIVTGLRGTIFDKFDYDVFGQFSRTKLQDISRNDLNFDRVQQALFVVDDGNGNAVCRDGQTGCVPWNIFGRSADGESLVTQEAVDFIQGVGIVVGQTDQRVVGGTISGDLGEYGFQSPLADGGVSALVGFEYRLDQLNRLPDDISQIPGGRGLTGVGGGTLPVGGQVEVTEVFMETEIPLINDMPFIQEWGLSGAYRHSIYNTKGIDPVSRAETTNSFSTDTWFIGSSWTPVDDIRFRVQFQRSIRAPNPFNLFLAQNTGLFNLSTGDNGLFDPCAGDFDPATETPEPQRSFEECQRTGVTAEQFGSIPDNAAGQFNSVTQGNPEVEAEVADTITIGAVFTPRAIPGLSIAIDYYDIKIDDAIGSIPEQTTLQNCLDDGDPAFCNLITRDQFGSLFLDNSNFEGIQSPSANIATLNTSGLDFSVKYNMDLDDIGLNGWGRMSFDYQATYLDELSTVPVEGAARVECAGFFAGQCDAPNPEYRHRLLTNWDTPIDGFRVTATWRYFGSTDIDGNAGTFLDESTGTQNYLDIVFRWQATENVGFRLGANNILDNNPPLNTSGGPPSGNGNTFPATFDVDRFIFFGVNLAY